MLAAFLESRPRLYEAMKKKKRLIPIKRVLLHFSQPLLFQNSRSFTDPWIWWPAAGETASLNNNSRH